MDKLTEVLQSKFGYTSFREGQKEIVEQILAGRDVVAVLPTGMGKSLLFQLPAYLLTGSVLIVSPLLSLMQDQVEQLKMIGEKRVVAVNSFLTFAQKENVFQNLGAYKFIFTSPEMLQNDRFNKILANIDIAYIVADEAHCISQWGFDFRPDYLRISKWLQSNPHSNVVALTATATKKVVEDIEKTLCMQKPFSYIHSVDRPAIAYEVKEVETQQEKKDWVIQRIISTSGPGILYTQSRKKSEMYAEELKKRGVKVSYYHAKMDQEDRILVQQQFQQGHLEWICATNAFGMGIHKDNIKQIIHDHIPTSIASYMQEVGRAGRNGEQSIASLIYCARDVEQAFFISIKDFPEEIDIKYYFQNDEKIIQLPETTTRTLKYWKEELSEKETIELFSSIKQAKWLEIQKLYDLFQNDQCVRKQLLHYFGEKLITRPNNCCTVCSLNPTEILYSREPTVFKKDILNWNDRLNELLPL